MSSSDRLAEFGKSMCGFYNSIFSTGYFYSSTDEILMQNVLSDSSFLCIILGLSCVYFLALFRMITSEKKTIKTKFEGIVDSVTKLNKQINVLEKMIVVMKNTNRREALYMKPPLMRPQTTQRRGRKRHLRHIRVTKRRNKATQLSFDDYGRNNKECTPEECQKPHQKCNNKAEDSHFKTRRRRRRGGGGGEREERKEEEEEKRRGRGRKERRGERKREEEEEEGRREKEERGGGGGGGGEGKECELESEKELRDVKRGKKRGKEEEEEGNKCALEESEKELRV
ncbi:hypothetical protein WDU94_008087 [Cyamophila willieti]